MASLTTRICLSVYLSVCLCVSGLQRFVSFAGHMRPVVDGDLRSDPVLPGEPRSLLEARDFTQLPILAGLVRDETLQTVLCT